MFKFLCIVCILIAQDNFLSSDIEENLAKKITRFQKNQRIASISFSLYKGRTYRYDYATGYADINKKIKATPDHIYPLASITKPLTASVLLDVLEEEHISLTDSVYTYVSDFPEDVTFNELLTHTSGFFRNKAYDDFIKGSDFTDVSNYLPKRWKRNKKNRYRYTNINYSAAGAAIDSISGGTFEDQMKTMFEFKSHHEPLVFMNEDSLPENIVKTYLQRYRRRYLHRPIKAGLWQPAALGATTAKGYAEFMRNTLTKSFIKKIESHKILVKERSYGKNKIYQEYYGLGFRLGYINNELYYVFHNGFIYGALTTFCYFPTHDIGYVALSNMSSYPRARYPFSRVIRKMVKNALDLDYNAPIQSSLLTSIQKQLEIPTLFVN